MSTNTVSFYIKTNRTISTIRKYAWTVTLLIGVGGQFIPQLGLLVPLIMLALIVMSLFKGKYWCGNFCPHGSFFDRIILPYSRNQKIPKFLRSAPLIAAVLIFFMFNMGARLFNVFQNLEATPLHVQLGSIFANTYLMVLLAGGLLGLFINSRTWCQFCPMGTMETIFYKLGKKLGIAQKYDEKVTIAHPDLCHSCAKCARVCPMQLKPYLEFSENNQLEDERCIRCYACVNNCPAGILHMATEKEAKKITQNTSLDGFDKATY